jgi:hypothetical protein
MEQEVENSGSQPRKRISRLEALRQEIALGTNHPDPKFRLLLQAFKESGLLETLLHNNSQSEKTNIRLDIDIVVDVFLFAVYVIEGGCSNYLDYRRQMLAELGEKIQPYLKLAYNQAREFSDVQGLNWSLSSRMVVDRYEEEMSVKR